MRKSLTDKIFFIDKINTDIIFDYGCADGSMIDFISQSHPDRFHFFGFDNDPKMIEFARSKNIPNSNFSTNFDELLSSAKGKKGKISIILSSIIHEIYSYLNQEDQDEFWKRVLKSNFDYIVIRDMYLIKIQIYYIIL